MSSVLPAMHPCDRLVAVFWVYRVRVWASLRVGGGSHSSLHHRQLLSSVTLTRTLTR